MPATESEAGTSPQPWRCVDPTCGCHSDEEVAGLLLPSSRVSTGTITATMNQFLREQYAPARSDWASRRSELSWRRDPNFFRADRGVYSLEGDVPQTAARTLRYSQGIGTFWADDEYRDLTFTWWIDSFVSVWKAIGEAHEARCYFKKVELIDGKFVIGPEASH